MYSTGTGSIKGKSSKVSRPLSQHACKFIIEQRYTVNMDWKICPPSQCTEGIGRCRGGGGIVENEMKNKKIKK